MTQMSETPEPWDIEDARRECEAREEREIFGPVMYSMSDAEFLKLRETARRDCDVCLYDRHCASHCPEDCEHRQEPLPCYCGGLSHSCGNEAWRPY